jgi:hypothetical protein
MSSHGDTASGTAPASPTLPYPVKGERFVLLHKQNYFPNVAPYGAM